MRLFIFYLMLICLVANLYSCRQKIPAKFPQEHYKTVDYITVGKRMDTIKPPYVVDVSAGVKRVIIIGCDHNRDTLHPQFKIIEKYFRALKPQVAFNEGGQVSYARHYVSLNQAITKAGEIGCLKFLSDQANIKMMNGDMTDSEEFKITLRKVPKDKLLLY